MRPTPHIEVKDIGIIADTVLMPGDPLRAKMIAEKYLENAQLFNNVRGMLGYTGFYKDRKISVMGSGMGMPSIGIYAYELFNNYGVENIIRVGSCGAYVEDLKVKSVFICTEAWSESSFAYVQSGYEDKIIPASEELTKRLMESARKLCMKAELGRIHSSDVFYRHDKTFREIAEESGTKAVEMESFALFATARLLGKKAACILTVSDNIATGELTTSEERQNSFTQMIEIALNA